MPDSRCTLTTDCEATVHEPGCFAVSISAARALLDADSGFPDDLPRLLNDEAQASVAIDEGDHDGHTIALGPSVMVPDREPDTPAAAVLRAFGWGDDLIDRCISYRFHAGPDGIVAIDAEMYVGDAYEVTPPPAPPIPRVVAEVEILGRWTEDQADSLRRHLATAALEWAKREHDAGRPGIGVGTSARLVDTP